MIDKDICLILGAGASSHLNFPLGTTLRDNIVDELESMKNNGLDKYNPDINQLGECIKSKEYLEEFRFKLLKGEWDSIDVFLEKHESFRPLGKYLICKILSQDEATAKNIKNLGWYHNLIRAISVENVSDFQNNKLSIETFNYDRSLDFAIHDFIKARYGMDDKEAWKLLRDSIEIVHVHGQLGDCEKYSYGSSENIYERSQDIKIIFEVGEELKDDSEIREAHKLFDRASILLEEAERVVVFGFGFAKDNVNRLNYFEKKEEAESRDIIIAMGETRGTNIDVKTRNWLEQWGLREKNIFFHSANRFFLYEKDPFE